MRLSAFIIENLEPILQEWENFARALGAVTESMNAAALRDHAKQILQEVAADLETTQSDAQQDAKSKGNAPLRPEHAPDTAAEKHGQVRASDGFSLEQMVAEYRALRASVLRLWTLKGSTYDRAAAEQVTRFNEAIDEALTESVERFARDLNRLMAAARSRERMAALGTLSAGLGHEMGNLLMPLGVCLDELEETPLPPEARPLLDSIRRSAEHLRSLTQGLRSLSVDPLNAEGSPQTTDLRAWWREAVGPYTWALGRGIKLHAGGFESSVPLHVNVPKHVLMQAVFNLVQNAAEALGAREGGGNIWVSATPASDGATVALTVRDDGPGMDPETRTRCTEPFFTTKPRARATGLGLALLCTALEKHKGRLVIESEPGKGSSFTLVLPVPSPRDTPPETRRRAMVTVQDPRTRATIHAFLAGMRVDVAGAQDKGF